MSEDWRFQASFKTPSGHMVNVRANNSLEFISALKDLPVEELLEQGALIFGGSYAAEQLTTPQVPAQRQPEAAVSGDPKTTCIHGARVHRSGTSARGPWSGWFCPTPKGSADQCKAVFG